MESIFIGMDDVGQFAYHLRDSEALPAAGNVRWRFVAKTYDFGEALRIMTLRLAALPGRAAGRPLPSKR